MESLINLVTWFPYWSQTLFFAWGAFGWFFTRVSNDVYEYWKTEEANKKAYDLDLFQKIKKKIIFVSNFRNEKFDGNFHKESTISPMFNFIDNEAIDPEWIFLDKKWEAIKIILFEKIKELSQFISSGSTDDIWDDFQGVPSRWETEQPEKFIEGQKILNALPNQVWEEYKKFLGYGKRRFKI